MKKLKLNDLKVTSFVTKLNETDSQTILGQDAGGASAVCNYRTRDKDDCVKTWNVDYGDCVIIRPVTIRYVDGHCWIEPQP